MKYSRSAITQLTRWYRQVLIKCAFLNAAIMAGTFGMSAIAGATEINQNGVPFQTATDINHAADSNIWNISTTTTNSAGDIGLNTFGKFNVSQGDIANLNLINQQNKLVNLVFDSSASQINGIVNSYKDGQIGGNILFANPNGFVVGKTGVFNVGSLTLMTPKESSMKQIFESNSVNNDALDSLVSFKFDGKDDVYILNNDDANLKLAHGKIKVDGTINSGEGIDLINAGEIEIGSTGALNANMNFSNSGANITATKKNDVTPNTFQDKEYKFAMDGGNGIIIASSNNADGGRDYLSSIVNISGKVKANGGNVHVQTEIYQTDKKEDDAVSKINIKNGADIEGNDVTMHAYSHIESADKNVIGVDWSDSGWMEIITPWGLTNFLVEDFVHLGDIKTQITVENGAKINASNNLTLKAEAILPISASSVFETFAFNYTDIDVLTEAIIKSGADIKVGNDLTVQALTDFEMTNATKASSLIEIVADTFSPFGHTGAYALTISLVDVINRAVIENSVNLDVKNNISVLASMLRNYSGETKNGFLPVVDRNRGAAGIGIGIHDFTATNEAIMNADATIDGSLVVNADYKGTIKQTVSATSAAIGEDGNFGAVGRIAQAILGHGKLTKVFDFLETAKKSRAEATFNKIQIAGAVNVAIDDVLNNAYIGDAAKGIKPTIKAKNVVTGATLIDNKSQAYASAEADNGETTTSGAVVVNVRSMASNADVYGDLTLTGADADNALIIRSKTDIQHSEGTWDWIKQTLIGFDWWKPSEEEPDLSNVNSANVDDYLAKYGMSDDYQKKIDDAGSKFALVNMVNFNDIGLNGLFNTFASSQANAKSKDKETNAWAGAVSVAITNAVSNALLHDGSTVNILNSTNDDIKQNILIQADSVSEIWNGAVLMSLFNAKDLFAGMSARDGDSTGGSFSIAVSNIDTTAKIGENVKISGQNSDVSVLAEENGEFINIGNGSASADNSGLGGVFVVSDVAGGETTASIEKDAEITNAKDVAVNAKRDDVYVNAAIAYTNSQNSKSFGISPLIASNAVTAYIAGDITATGKVSVTADYDKVTVNTAANAGVAKAGTDNPVFTDVEPEDDDSDVANLDVLFENLSVFQSTKDPTKYVKTDFSRPMNADKETSAYAGNIVTNIFDSDIQAYVADDAKIVADSLEINATSEDTIVDVGAIFAANGKSGGGATILFDMSKNQIDSYIGKAIVDVVGNLTIGAKEEYMMVDMQAGIAHGKDKSGVGNLSANLQLNEINAGIKNGAKVNTNTDNANQSVNVSADLENKTIKVVGGLSIQAGGDANGGAKGAALDANVYANTIRAYIEDADVNASKELNVTADSTAKIISVDAAGAASTGDSAYAGTLGTYISANDIDAHISGSKINQTEGRSNKAAATKVKASSAYKEVAVTGTVAGGKQTAVGGSVRAQIISDDIDSYIKNTTLDTTNSLTLENEAEIKSVAVTVAGAVSTSKSAIDGAIMAVIDGMTQNNYIEDSMVKATSLTMNSDNTYDAIGITGAVAISTNENAIGGSIYATITDNDINTYIKNSDITAQNDIQMTSSQTTDNLSIIFAGGGGEGTAASGAVSTVVNSADVNTFIQSDNGNNKVKTDNGKVAIKSTDTTDIDTINAAASIGFGDLDIGASINTVVDDSNVSARIEGMEVTAKKDVNVDAESTEEIMSISVGGAGGSGITAAGSINTVVMASDTGAYINNSVVKGDSVNIISKGTTEITGGTGSLGVTTSLAAFGASVVTGVIDSEVTAVIENSKVDAEKNVVVSAEANETIGKSDAPFITIAGGFSEGLTLEGAIDTLIMSSTADARIIGTKTINDVVYGVKAKNDVSIKAKGTDTIFAIGGAVSSSSEIGVGATVNTIVVDKDVEAYAENAKIEADHDIMAEATENDDFFTTIVAAGGAGTTGAAGVVNTNVITSDLKAGFKNSTLKAGNKISSNVEASADMQTITGAAAGGGTAGIGLSAVNDIIKYTEDSYVTGNAEFKELDVNANADNSYSFVTISGAGGGTAGVAGVENVNYVNNTIKAYAEGVLTGKDDTKADKININASDEVTFEDTGAGTAAVGGTAGVGGTVMVNSVTSTVEASLGGSKVKADDIDVKANGKQTFDTIVAAGFAGAGEVAFSGTVMVNDIDTTIQAHIKDNTNIAATDVDIEAENTAELTAFTGAGAVGGMGAMGASVNVNSFSATTEAYTSDNVTLNAKNVDISAENKTTIGTKDNRSNMAVVAGSAGLYAGIAGSVLWNTIENKTAAYIGKENTVTLADAGHLNLNAKDTSSIYESLGAGAAGAVGIGASVGGNEIHNTVLAYIGAASSVAGANADISVSAKSEENVDAFDVVVGGGLGALSGGAVYTSIGKKVDNAAYNNISAEEKKTFAGAKTQSDDMNSKADEKVSGANTSYQNAYNDAINKIDGKSDKQRVSQMKANNSLYTKTGKSSVTGTNRDGTTSAFIDTGSILNVKDLKVNAEDKNDVKLESAGGAIGLAAIGVSVAIAEDLTTTNAFVSNGVEITAGSAEINAKSEDKHDLQVWAAAGGIVGGGGSSAEVNSQKTTNAYILKDTNITTTNSSKINTTSTSDIDIFAGSASLGGVSVGTSFAYAKNTGTTRIDIGDNVVLNAGGDVIISTNTDEKSEAEAWAAAGTLLGGTGANALSKAGKDNTINIGKNLTTDIKGNLKLSSNAKNRAYTEANGRAYGAVTAGVATGESKIDQTSGVNIADADEVKTIKSGAIDISSKADNEAKTDVYAGAGAVLGLSLSTSKSDIDSTNKIYVGKNYNVKTTDGGYLLSAETQNEYKGYIKSDSYGVVTGAVPELINDVDSTVSSDSEADVESAGSLIVAAKNEVKKTAVSGYDLYGGAGGLTSGSGGSIKDNITITTNAKLGGNKARANGAYSKGDITVGAYNIADINEKADLYAHGGIAGADTDSIVYLTANAKTEITNKDISNYDDDINYVARNDIEIYTKSNVESYGGVAGTGGDSKAQSSKQHADVIISGDVKSKSGRSTNISALSNKSLTAHIYERTRGLASVISGDSYAYNNDSEASIDIQSGAQVKSYDSMNLTALSSTQKLSATRDAIAYQLWGIPYKGKGNTHTENKNSSSITINGAVESGVGANRKLTINKDGTYTADGVNVLGMLKVGEITSADIDTDIAIYQNSINDANAEYNDFVKEQDKLIAGYQKRITDNTTAKAEKEAQNAGYRDDITIWGAINDIDSADFATKYATSTIEVIKNLVTALNGGNTEAISTAKAALNNAQPSSTVAQLNQKITENTNTIKTYNEAIALAGTNKTAAENQKTVIATKHTAEIAKLQAEIDKLETQKQTGTTTNIYVMTLDNVKVRSGETNINTGTLSGSGSVTAPGNTFTITVDNNSVNAVQYGDLIIDRNLDGDIHINASDTLSVTKTIINPNYDSKITITNHVDANDPTINFEGQSGDIWLKGNIENVNGVVDITNFTGSILSEASITAKDLYMKAPNGELSQVYDPNERNTGSMIAGGDISYAAKTININGLIQSGSEIKNIEIPEFSISFADGKYYQTINGVETEMKPSEMTDGYYYLSLLNYTETLNSIQKIKTYFKPQLDSEGNAVVDADGHVQGEIYLFKADIGGGNITLTGNIVSDSNNGKIVLVNGYGHIDVVNNSNYDLVTSALNADNKVQGVLTINDFKFASGDDTTYDTITQENLTPEYLAEHAGTYTAQVGENGQISTTATNVTDGNGYWGTASSSVREDGANVYSTTYNPGNDAYMITEQGKTVSYQVYVERSWIVELFCGKKYETRYYYQEPKYGVKANAITVNFQGFDKPEINVTSNGNVVMNSNISALTGDVNITSQNGDVVTKSSSNVISANNITLNAKGNIGEEVVTDSVYRPIQTAIFDNGKLTATAGKDIYVNFPYTEISNVNLNAGNGNGNIYLATAAGDFDGTEKQVSIKADALDLRADYIGLDTTVNENVNIDIKKLKARAKDDVTITNKGDVFVSSIVSENGGTVTIESKEGSIVAAADTGTYSDKHIHGGNIVLRAVNGAIATKENILKFANDGIFHVEAKNDIYLGSAGNIYVDLIKSTKGNVDLGSQRGIIASTISDEGRYYNIAGKDINLSAWGGSIENIALNADGTVNASTYLSGLGDINIAQVSQTPLTEDSTQAEIDAFNANAKDLKIGIIKAGNNVTLSSEKGIKQDYGYSDNADFGITGERITLNASGDIGSTDEAVNTKVNRTISAFSSEGSNIYLSANNADYGMKIATIDTYNGKDSLGMVALTSAGHILDNAEEADKDIINIRAENIVLNAEKNIGSVDDYMVVETTSEDADKGLAYKADEAYIKGVGDKLNIAQGQTTGTADILAEEDTKISANNITSSEDIEIIGNADISVNNITADNNEHTADIIIAGGADVRLSNAKAADVAVSGDNVVIANNITTDHLDIGSAGTTTLQNAGINKLTDNETNAALAEVKADGNVIVNNTSVHGDVNIASNADTNISTLTVDGDFTNTSDNTTISCKLDVTGNANIDAKENIKIADADIGGDLNADAENIEIAKMKLDGNINATVDDLSVNTSNDLHIGSISGNTADYTNTADITSSKNITNGLGADNVNMVVKNANLTVGDSIGENQALNIELANGNKVNINAGNVANLNNTGAVANYNNITADDTIITATNDVNIANLNTDKLALTTDSENVNITGDVKTKGTIETASKDIVIDNTSLEPYPDATAQLYLTQKPMHLIVDGSNNIRTESQNVTRHNKNIVVNKETNATSMEGEINLASETALRNSYHGKAVMNEADDSLYNSTISDYVSSVVGSRDHLITDGNGSLINNINVMDIIQQRTPRRPINQNLSQDDERKKKNKANLKKAEDTILKNINVAAILGK